VAQTEKLFDAKKGSPATMPVKAMSLQEDWGFVWVHIDGMI
jgi:hypothetical protein